MDSVLLCPAWKRALSGTVRIIAAGLSVRCRACGNIHVVPRAQLEAYWRQMPAEDAPTQQALPVRSS